VNKFISTRFNRYQQLLVVSPAISHFNILKQNVTPTDGRIRIKASLVDGGLLEFAEYIAVDQYEAIATYTYTFHWQNSHKQLVQRWDNVNHFPGFPNAPHHIHQADGTVIGNSDIPTLEMILAEVEKALRP
jgi:hypothetical protein